MHYYHVNKQALFCDCSGQETVTADFQITREFISDYKLTWILSLINSIAAALASGVPLMMNTFSPGGCALRLISMCAPDRSFSCRIVSPPDSLRDIHRSTAHAESTHKSGCGKLGKYNHSCLVGGHNMYGKHNQFQINRKRLFHLGNIIHSFTNTDLPCWLTCYVQ